MKPVVEAVVDAAVAHPKSPELVEETEVKRGISKLGAAWAFIRNGTCSRSMMSIVDRRLGHPLPLEEAAADPLAGGMMQGYQCGMLWGASLAAGAQAYRLLGPGPQAEAAALAAAQQLTAAFHTCNGTINCLEITETSPQDNWRVFVHFFVKGGIASCVRQLAEYVPQALGEIDTTLHADPADRAAAPQARPCDPVSCAAVMARRLGASEAHTVMAAGLAGGIGLSGGGCGALGAAIWLTSLRALERGAKSKVVFARASELYEAFLESSDYEVECAEIVGRRFASARDHADHLRRGGCARLLEALAAAAGEDAEGDQVERAEQEGLAAPG